MYAMLFSVKSKRASYWMEAFLQWHLLLRSLYEIHPSSYSNDACPHRTDSLVALRFVCWYKQASPFLAQKVVNCLAYAFEPRFYHGIAVGLSALLWRCIGGSNWCF